VCVGGGGGGVFFFFFFFFFVLVVFGFGVRTCEVVWQQKCNFLKKQKIYFKEFGVGVGYVLGGRRGESCIGIEKNFFVVGGGGGGGAGISWFLISNTKHRK